MQQYLTNYGDVVSVVEGIEINNELLGTSVAMTKGNSELLEVVDKVITEAKENGDLDKVFEDNIDKASKAQEQ